MEIYDLIVIGAGPGGYKTAELAAKRDLIVALIEKDHMGGVCLNQGCIPFKSYLNISKLRERLNDFNRKKIFEGNAEICIDQEKVRNETLRIVKILQKSIINELKKSGIEIFIGFAYIQGIEKGYVTVSVNEKIIKGKKLVIATGSREKEFPQSCEKTFYPIIYSDQIINMKKFPKKILIMGSGAAGLEIASYLNGIGCEVTVMEKLAHIGGKMDLEVSANIKECLEKKGVRFLLNTSLVEFRKDRVILRQEKSEIQEKPECVIVSIGRNANVEGFGISNCKIDYSEAGIKINEKCETNNHLVFACGDVTGKMMLAHTAYRQAKVIVDTICGDTSFMDYTYIPRIIYTNPEVIIIGLSEEECIEQKILYHAKSLPMTYSGKYLAEYGKDNTRAKMIINVNTHEILGIHIVGNDVSELALALEMMISYHLTVEEIERLVFPHPTISEIICELVRSFL